jgi:hypothetical protein
MLDRLDRLEAAAEKQFKQINTIEKLMHGMHQSMRSKAIFPAAEHESPKNKCTTSVKGMGGSTKPSEGSQREENSKDGSLSHRGTLEEGEKGSKDRGKGLHSAVAHKCSTSVLEEKGNSQKGAAVGTKFNKKALRGGRRM